MELIDRITEDIKSAMFAKDKLKPDALRGIKKNYKPKPQKIRWNNNRGSRYQNYAKNGKATQRKCQIYIEQNRPELEKRTLMR